MFLLVLIPIKNHRTKQKSLRSSTISILPYFSLMHVSSWLLSQSIIILGLTEVYLYLKTFIETQEIISNIRKELSTRFAVDKHRFGD